MWTPPERIKHPLPPARWPSADEAARSRLFSPVVIGPRTARQRTWVPAMVPWRASEEGLVTDAVIDWYARLAAGRPGVLVVEATGIRDVPSGPLLRIGHDRFIPGLSALCRAVREASCGETLLFIQVIDFLAIRRRPERQRFLSDFLAIDADLRRRLADRLTRPGLIEGPEPLVRAALLALDDDALDAVLSPRQREDLRFGHRERVTDLHLPHIRALPAALPGLFAAAAARAEAAGFDGVELHYAHAYTMASFLSPTNTRDDGYGRTAAGRLRLPLEVVAAARGALAERTVLGARFLGDEAIPGGGTIDDAMEIGRALAGAGLDFLSLSRGGKFDDAQQPKVGWAAYPYTGPSGYACMPTVHSDARGPFGRNAHLAAAVRAAVRADGLATPVVAAGGIALFDQAEALLASGACDLVAAARQSLADPDWFRKMRLGRGDQIRRCHFTNYCEALDQHHKQVTCKLWDHQGLDEPGVRLDATGRRRLTAPAWTPGGSP
jgi:2,4-dienoyl-CoA reductase-like NADH-dependent reductase (Old Yellow Enzyme family)